VLECIQRIIQEMHVQRGVDIAGTLAEKKEEKGVDVVREITKEGE